MARTKRQARAATGRKAPRMQLVRGVVWVCDSPAHPALCVRRAAGRGYGCFARRCLLPGTVLPIDAVQLCRHRKPSDDRLDHLADAELDALVLEYGMEGPYGSSCVPDVSGRGTAHPGFAANEPAAGEPNARLRLRRGRVVLVIDRAVPRDGEVTICYGPRYARTWQHACAQCSSD